MAFEAEPSLSVLSVVASAHLGGSCKCCAEAGLKGAHTAKQNSMQAESYDFLSALTKDITAVERR